MPMFSLDLLETQLYVSKQRWGEKGQVIQVVPPIDIKLMWKADIYPLTHKSGPFIQNVILKRLFRRQIQKRCQIQEGWEFFNEARESVGVMDGVERLGREWNLQS